MLSVALLNGWRGGAVARLGDGTAPIRAPSTEVIAQLDVHRIGGGDGELFGLLAGQHAELATPVQEAGVQFAELGSWRAFLTGLRVAAALGFGSLGMLDARFAIGDAMALLVLAHLVGNPLRGFARQCRFAPLKEAVHDLADLDRTRPIPPPPAGEPRHAGSRIELTDVCWSGGLDQPLAVDRVTFDLDPGSHLGIAGASASGKTVITHLLTGLKRPTRGTVLIDGRAPSELPTATAVLIERVGAVFDATVRDNLLLGAPLPEAARTERRAAQPAQSHPRAAAPAEPIGDRRGPRQHRAAARSTDLRPRAPARHYPRSGDRSRREPAGLRPGPATVGGSSRALGFPMTALAQALRLLARATGVPEPPVCAAANDADPRALALSFGIRLRRVRLYERAWWRADNGPLLVFQRVDGAPLVLLPASGPAYRIHDPTTGTAADLGEAGAAELREEAFMPYPRARALPRRVWLGVAAPGGSKDARWHLSCTIAAAGLSFAPAIAALGLDRLLREGRREAFGVVMLSLVAVAGGSALFGHAGAIEALRWRGRANLRLHAMLWDRILALPAAAYRNIPGWRLEARWRAALYGSQRELETRLVARRGAAELALGLGLLAIAMPVVVPPAIAALGAAFALQYFLCRHAEGARLAVEALQPNAAHGTYLIARFLPQLRTLGNEGWLLSRVKGDLARIIAASNDAAAAHATAASARSLGAGLVPAAAITAAVMAGSAKPGVGMLAFITLVGLSASRAAVAIAGATAIRPSNRTRIDGISPLMESADTAPHGCPPLGRIERIELDAVSFRYPGASTDCIDGASLSVSFFNPTSCQPRYGDVSVEQPWHPPHFMLLSQHLRWFDAHFCGGTAGTGHSRAAVTRSPRRRGRGAIAAR
jgi:ABC-type bacteriocin/lantibiotic exporter with double-glycine peptidase domain